MATSVDSLAAGNNPAGMVFVGSRLDVGGDIFSPMRSYSVSGGPNPQFFDPGTPTDPSDDLPSFSLGLGSVDSESNYFLIPSFGYNRMLVPLIVQAPGTFGAGDTGVNLSILFAGVTYARKINQDSAWGVSGVLAYSQFEAKGLSNFSPFSADASALSNTGTSSATGVGLKFGWQGQVTPAIRLGAAYQTKIDMGEFDDYAGLFAEGGDFDLPPYLGVGLTWNISDIRRFFFDVQQIMYSEVDAIANPIAGIFPPPFGGQCVPTQNPTAAPATGAGCLGGSSGAGFGWDDMTVLKFGYEWDSDDWTWRLGFSHGEQPIPDSEVLFNILAPATVEDHLTFGFTRQLGSDSELTFHAMHALNNSVSGTNPFDPSQTVEIEMNQFEFGVSYGMRF